MWPKNIWQSDLARKRIIKTIVAEALLNASLSNASIFIHHENIRQIHFCAVSGISKSSYQTTVNMNLLSILWTHLVLK